MKTIEELNLEFDPRCPGCGNVHPRKRIGNTHSFQVKMNECRRKGTVGLCKYNGPLVRTDFEKGLKIEAEM